MVLCPCLPQYRPTSSQGSKASLSTQKALADSLASYSKILAFSSIFQIIQGHKPHPVTPCVTSHIHSNKPRRVQVSPSDPSGNKEHKLPLPHLGSRRQGDKPSARWEFQDGVEGSSGGKELEGSKLQLGPGAHHNTNNGVLMAAVLQGGSCFNQVSCAPCALC